MKKYFSFLTMIIICIFISSCSHAHTWQAATCTNPKTCSECGATEGKALGHYIESWVVSEDPTCTKEGDEVGTCSTCNNSIHHPIAKVNHTPGDWVVTKEVSPSSDGERTQSCIVCGGVLNKETFTLSAEEIESHYKAACVEYSYDTIARDPDKYEDTYGRYTGEIIQVLESNNNYEMRVNITKDNYGYYEDTIYVVYAKKEDEPRLLEDDIITIYGINLGTTSYESIFGATITLPCVYAEYIDIN